MSKYQLWSRDEYGQGSILFTSEDIDEVIKRGKFEVTDLNVNNALTADDREKNWEAYMVMIIPAKKKSKTKYVYAGGDPRTKNNVYVFDKEKEPKTVEIPDIPNSVVRIYLGNISTSRKEEINWFANDVRRNVIDSIDHRDLESKTQFFIKKV